MDTITLKVFNILLMEAKLTQTQVETIISKHQQWYEFGTYMCWGVPTLPNIIRNIKKTNTTTKRMPPPPGNWDGFTTRGFGVFSWGGGIRKPCIQLVYGWSVGWMGECLYTWAG